MPQTESHETWDSVRLIQRPRPRPQGRPTGVGYLVAAILRWAQRAQISDHAALAVVVGGDPSVAGRGFNIVAGSSAQLASYTTKEDALAALSAASGHPTYFLAPLVVVSWQWA